VNGGWNFCARIRLKPWATAVIEAQIPASQYRELGLTEGDVLVLTPRKARVFVEGHPDFVHAA